MICSHRNYFLLSHPLPFHDVTMTLLALALLLLFVVFGISCVQLRMGLIAGERDGNVVVDSFGARSICEFYSARIRGGRH